MAKKKKSTKRTARRASTSKAKKRPKAAPKCCECPSTAARKAFKLAKTCSEKTRALTEVNRLVNEDAENMKPGSLRLLRADIGRKMKQVSDLCEREEASDAARFNGLSGTRRRKKRKTARR